MDVEQMRASIRRLVSVRGRGCGGPPPNIIVAGLIVAAVLPLVVPLVGAGGFGVAAGGLFAILQDYGKGYLSEAVKGAIDRLRPDKQDEAPSASAVQARLEQELLAGFNADGERAVALREEAGLLLRSIGGVQVARTRPPWTSRPPWRRDSPRSGRRSRSSAGCWARSGTPSSTSATPDRAAGAATRPARPTARAADQAEPPDLDAGAALQRAGGGRPPALGHSWRAPAADRRPLPVQGPGRLPARGRRILLRPGGAGHRSGRQVG